MTWRIQVGWRLMFKVYSIAWVAGAGLWFWSFAIQTHNPTTLGIAAVYVGVADVMRRIGARQ